MLAGQLCRPWVSDLGTQARSCFQAQVPEITRFLSSSSLGLVQERMWASTGLKVMFCLFEWLTSVWKSGNFHISCTCLATPKNGVLQQQCADRKPRGSASAPALLSAQSQGQGPWPLITGFALFSFTWRESAIVCSSTSQSKVGN
jgi:hypothetical protein